MGLAEKRALNELQTKAWPGYLARIQAAASYPVEVVPNWESLMPTENNAAHFVEFFDRAFVKPLELMFQEFCKDDFTKNAVREGLKKIEIIGDADAWSSTKFGEFKAGTLTVRHDSYTNLDDFKDRSETARKAVESGL